MSIAPYSSALTPSLEHLVYNSRTFFEVIHARTTNEMPRGCKTLAAIASKPKYSHHWLFITALRDTTESDLPVIATAAHSLWTSIREINGAWDGGMQSRRQWAHAIDSISRTMEEDELRNRTVHLILFKPHLFQGSTDDIDVLRAEWRRKADDCFEAVLAHLLDTAQCAARTSTPWWSWFRRAA